MTRVPSKPERVRGAAGPAEADCQPWPLGRPRLHLREIDSTNARAVRSARAGAPHGTLVTATAQTAGRGRQGRGWSAPPGQALLLSLVLRRWDPLVSLRAGLAVADIAGPAARVKWPNDVLVGGRKVAGVLAERRADAPWVVLGVGINLAVDLSRLAPDVARRAGTLGREPRDLEPSLAEFLTRLRARLCEPVEAVVSALAERDALRGSTVAWGPASTGTAVGIGSDGSLLVRLGDGSRVALAGGEVHLQPVEPPLR